MNAFRSILLAVVSDFAKKRMTLPGTFFDAIKARREFR
jgi:hypothetical protein